MSLHITTSLMFSDATPHTAREEDGTWAVSWLPGRRLDREQAVSAMQIAVTSSSVEPGNLNWLHLDGWAQELGLGPAEAVAMASRPPEGTP
jgi:hypothetical protein